jgi:hypothetical protein
MDKGSLDFKTEMLLMGIIEGALDLINVKVICQIKDKNQQSQIQEEERTSLSIEVNFVTKRHLKNFELFNLK